MNAALSRSLWSSVLLWICVSGCGDKEAPVVDHDPPEIIEVFQSATEVSPGGTVTLRVEARDVPDASLRFAWGPEAGTVGTPTETDASSEVTWSAPECVLKDTPTNIQASVTNAWGLSAHRILTVKVLKGCLSWPTTASMAIPRFRHTASVLASGKVLVTGGADASAELYDPQTESWMPTGSMSTPRFSHTASVLASGKVLVVGGSEAVTRDTVLASAELYDPTTGTWEPAGNMSSPRYDHTASVLASGKVLIVGGADSRSPLASAELYDPVTGSWEPVASMSTARQGHTDSVLSSGKVLITGGNGGVARVASAELYDPSTGSWSPAGEMHNPRQDHTASLLHSGEVLITAGAGEGELSDAEVYAPRSNSWVPVGSMQESRRFHRASVLPSGKVLVTGGTGSDSLAITAELYDPATRLWTRVGTMNTARFHHTSTVLPSGSVLIVGGINQEVLSSAELYDTSKLH